MAEVDYLSASARLKRLAESGPVDANSWNEILAPATRVQVEPAKIKRLARIRRAGCQAFSAILLVATMLEPVPRTSVMMMSPMFTGAFTTT